MAIKIINDAGIEVDGVLYVRDAGSPIHPNEKRDWVPLAGDSIERGSNETSNPPPILRTVEGE